MNLQKNSWRSLTSCCYAAMMLALAGCDGSGSNAAANSSGAANANNPELFTIPQDQMSHVQVLTVQPTTLTRIAPPDRSRGLQQFSHDAGDHAG